MQMKFTDRARQAIHTLKSNPTQYHDLREFFSNSFYATILEKHLLSKGMIEPCGSLKHFYRATEEIEGYSSADELALVDMVKAEYHKWNKSAGRATNNVAIPASSTKSITDATPRELLRELKARGYIWKEMYLIRKDEIKYETI